MASSLSRSPLLRIAASLFATIFVGFGVNAILQPQQALTFFEFKAPSLPADRQLVDALMVIYGARDLFMGLAIYATVYYGTRKALGAILIAASGVAFVDGAVCWAYAGNGQWNHWGYAPVIILVGSLLLDVLDQA